ncbi:ABC transporter, partial [Verminephrobacter sp. Larva24]
MDASDVFADPVGAGLRAMLMPQENVLALLKVDLSAALRFAAAWVVLSTDRLLTCDAGSPHWRSWPLNAALTLRLQDHGGVGTLE